MELTGPPAVDFAPLIQTVPRMPVYAQLHLFANGLRKEDPRYAGQCRRNGIMPYTEARLRYGADLFVPDVWHGSLLSFEDEQQDKQCYAQQCCFAGGKIWHYEAEIRDRTGRGSFEGFREHEFKDLINFGYQHTRGMLAYTNCGESVADELHYRSDSLGTTIRFFPHKFTNTQVDEMHMWLREFIPGLQLAKG